MFIWIHFQQIIFILSEIETTSCVCVYCHQFLNSDKHIFLVIGMNISFLLYFWKEKNYLIYCINKTTNYIVSWLFTKKHHARYVSQSVLYHGESRNSNYDDLLWVHGPRVGNWSWQRVGGMSSKNRLESPLIYIYIYICLEREREREREKYMSETEAKNELSWILTLNCVCWQGFTAGKSDIILHCHYFQVHSNPNWLYLLESCLSFR